MAQRVALIEGNFRFNAGYTVEASEYFQLVWRMEEINSYFLK